MSGKQKFLIILIISIFLILLISGFVIYLLVEKPFPISAADRYLITQQIIIRSPELVRDIFNSLILLSAVFLTKWIVKSREKKNICEYLDHHTREIISDMVNENKVLESKIEFKESEIDRLKKKCNRQNIALRKISELPPEIYE